MYQALRSFIMMCLVSILMFAPVHVAAASNDILVVKVTAPDDMQKADFDLNGFIDEDSFKNTPMPRFFMSETGVTIHLRVISPHGGTCAILWGEDVGKELKGNLTIVHIFSCPKDYPLYLNGNPHLNIDGKLHTYTLLILNVDDNKNVFTSYRYSIRYSVGTIS